MPLLRTGHRLRSPLPARPQVSRWERVLAWSLRAALVAMAIYHAVIGDLVLVGYSALAFAVLLVPPILARTSHANIPVELEIVLSSCSRWT